MVSEIEELKKRVALANRIIYATGLATSLGHASARVPGEDLAVIKARRSPAVPSLGYVTEEEMALVELDGKQISGKHPAPGETKLHTEIYRARDDVGGVVHIHPKYSTALVAAGREIEPVLHMESGVVAPGVPVYGSPELIKTEEQGSDVAKKLGNALAISLLNHGVVTVGEDVESATLNSIRLERLAEENYLAATLGRAKKVGDKSIRAMNSIAAGEGSLHWDYYRTLDSILRGQGGRIKSVLSASGDVPATTVARACRVLYNRGLVEYVEHVSTLGEGERFIINPIRSMEDIDGEDMITVDFDGKLVSGEGRLPGHVFLHGEIYRARPDVSAIVHTHPRYGRAFGMTGVPVLPIFHDRSYHAVSQPALFERAEVARSAKDGKEAVTALGDADVMHLCGHGMEFLADSVERATVMAVHFEELAEANHIARQLGEPSTVPPDMALGQLPGNEGIQSEWECLLCELERV